MIEFPANNKLQDNQRIRSNKKIIDQPRNKKGTVIIGGYPYPSRQNDGFFQRIKAVDKLLIGKKRIYLDRLDKLQIDSWCDVPAPNTLVLNISGKYIFRAGLHALYYILRTPTIYFHSILSVKKFQWLMRCPFIKKIVDIHGVVPEEFEYQGDQFNAQKFNKIEEKTIKRADYLIVVSEAMKNHITKKYEGVFSGEFLILPILPEIPKQRTRRIYNSNQPIIIYAGGLQKWQQVQKMIDIITQTASLYHYKFYCPNPNEMNMLLPVELINSTTIEINSKSHNELLNEYQNCDFGFILRENNIVNTVSCPTKLVEYIAMGIIPIVDSPNIGDFKSLGLEYINAEDILNHTLPNKETYLEMVKKNYLLYQTLQKIHSEGATSLQQVVA